MCRPGCGCLSAGQNKKLSDTAEPALVLQGISYLVRTGVGLATISIEVHQYEAPAKPTDEGEEPAPEADAVWHLDIQQSASKLTSTTELRCLDDVPRQHSDRIFGTVLGHSHWTTVEELEDSFLRSGWRGPAEGELPALIWTRSSSVNKGWSATQVWGFQDVDGERRYCRNLLVVKDDQRVECRFVYDYVPPEA